MAVSLPASAEELVMREKCLGASCAVALAIHSMSCGHSRCEVAAAGWLEQSSLRPAMIRTHLRSPTRGQLPRLPSWTSPSWLTSHSHLEDICDGSYKLRKSDCEVPPLCMVQSLHFLHHPLSCRYACSNVFEQSPGSKSLLDFDSSC